MARQRGHNRLMARPTITSVAASNFQGGNGSASNHADEPLPAWKLLAAALVMAGLAINLLWPRWRAMRP